MSSSPLSPDEIRAAAEVHRELGPEYSDVVVESFFEKVDREIGARIDARLAALPRETRREVDPVKSGREVDPVKSGRRHALLIGAGIGSAVTGIPLTLFVLFTAGQTAPADAAARLLVIWLVIVAVYAACAVPIRLPRRRD